MTTVQATAARDAERAAIRQAERERIDAVMKSVDDQKRMLQVLCVCVCVRVCVCV